MEAYYGEPCCTLCRMRDLLFCGIFSSGDRKFSCKHLPGFHENGLCGMLPSRICCSQFDESAAQMPLLVTKGTTHLVDGVNGRSVAQMLSSLTICERGYIANLLSERMVSESKLLQQVFQPVVVPPMHGLYNWGHHFQLPEPGQGCVSFTADTSNDVHVAISTEPESMDPMYEIVVGGWGNTASVMRRRSQGPVLCTVPVGLKKPLPSSVNNLWVTIDKKTQFIQVGRGTQPSLESLFCIYKDPQFLSEAQHICFTTWDAPATYSNIKVSAME